MTAEKQSLTYISLITINIMIKWTWNLNQMEPTIPKVKYTKVCLYSGTRWAKHAMDQFSWFISMRQFCMGLIDPWTAARAPQYLAQITQTHPQIRVIYPTIILVNHILCPQSSTIFRSRSVNVSLEFRFTYHSYKRTPGLILNGLVDLQSRYLMSKRCKWVELTIHTTIYKIDKRTYSIAQGTILVSYNNLNSWTTTTRVAYLSSSGSKESRDMGDRFYLGGRYWRRKWQCTPCALENPHVEKELRQGAAIMESQETDTSWY